MLFSYQDMELLRLLRLCRCILPEDLRHYFSETTISNLKSLRLIRTHNASGALTLSSEGNALLDLYCSDLPANSRIAYKPHDTIRRIRLSKLLLTVHRADLKIESSGIAALQNNQICFLPTFMRKRGQNVWSNSRIAALLRLGDILCAAHFIAPDIGSIHLVEELNAFGNNTAMVKDVRRAFLFAGESYESILAELEKTAAKNEGQMVSYADAYQKIQMPIFLLPCDDTGAMQLQLMTIPNYRKRLTCAALKSQYAPPPQEHPEFDAIFQGTPFVMAADMDLHRLEQAAEKAKMLWNKQIALVCLEAQAKAFFFPRYRDTGKARVFVLTQQALTDALGETPALHEPSRYAYKTSEGDVIDAPLIKTNRKG